MSYAPTQPPPGFRKVELSTAEGEHVTYGLMPHFETPPAVLTWGSRTFFSDGARPAAQGPAPVYLYRECFAAALAQPVDQLPEAADSLAGGPEEPSARALWLLQLFGEALDALSESSAAYLARIQLLTSEAKRLTIPPEEKGPLRARVAAGLGNLIDRIGPRALGALSVFSSDDRAVITGRAVQLLCGWVATKEQEEAGDAAIELLTQPQHLAEGLAEAAISIELHQYMSEAVTLALQELVQAGALLKDGERYRVSLAVGGA